MFTNHIYLTSTYKEDLAFNNLICLIYHKTKAKGVKKKCDSVKKKKN